MRQEEVEARVIAHDHKTRASIFILGKDNRMEKLLERIKAVGNTFQVYCRITGDTDIPGVISRYKDSDPIHILNNILKNALWSMVSSNPKHVHSHIPIIILSAMLHAVSNLKEEIMSLDDKGKAVVKKLISVILITFESMYEVCNRMVEGQIEKQKVEQDTDVSRVLQDAKNKILKLEVDDLENIHNMSMNAMNGAMSTAPIEDYAKNLVSRVKSLVDGEYCGCPVCNHIELSITEMVAVITTSLDGAAKAKNSYELAKMFIYSLSAMSALYVKALQDIVQVQAAYMANEMDSQEPSVQTNLN